MAGGAFSSPAIMSLLNAANQGAFAGNPAGALSGLQSIQSAANADRDGMLGMAEIGSQIQAAAMERQKWLAEQEAARRQQEAVQSYAGLLESPEDRALLLADPENFLQNATQDRWRDPWKTINDSLVNVRAEGGPQSVYQAPMTPYQQAQAANLRAKQGIEQQKLGLERQKFAHDQKSGGPEVTAALRTRAAKIADVMRLNGTDEATATAIVDGFVNTVTDPVRGTSGAVNLITGDTRRIEFPTRQIEPIGDGTTPIPINEMAKEIGAVPWAEDVLSKTLGQAVPGIVDEARTKAATQLQFVKRLAMDAFSTNSRPPIWEQQQVADLFPSKGLYDSSTRAEQQLGQVRDMIEFTHNEYANQINSGVLPVEQENELRGKIAQLHTLRTLMPESTSQAPQQPQQQLQQQLQQQPNAVLQQRATAVRAEWNDITETAAKYGLTPEQVIQRLEQNAR